MSSSSQSAFRPKVGVGTKTGAIFSLAPLRLIFRFCPGRSSKELFCLTWPDPERTLLFSISDLGDNGFRKLPSELLGFVMTWKLLLLPLLPLFCLFW